MYEGVMHPPQKSILRGEEVNLTFQKLSLKQKLNSIKKNKQTHV